MLVWAHFLTNKNSSRLDFSSTKTNVTNMLDYNNMARSIRPYVAIKLSANVIAIYDLLWDVFATIKIHRDNPNYCVIAMSLHKAKKFTIKRMQSYERQTSLFL